ncbi:hypothetical protein N6G02_05035 [Cupriavidus gilardii]|uniref:hypothetical protein n=1 Tax=Cupriavidus gilardii TaxID=82541 RepID=UPI0021BE0140|nr:hypothetical protein [Cupriavidus gilardii]MCT9115483.1 hypothetical protein [Cupriavidus gilardii]
MSSVSGPQSLPSTSSHSIARHRSARRWALAGFALGAAWIAISFDALEFGGCWGGGFLFFAASALFVPSGLICLAIAAWRRPSSLLWPILWLVLLACVAVLVGAAIPDSPCGTA